MLQTGGRIELIDVRTPVEFREVHASPARNVPLDQLDAATLADKPYGTSEPLYLICQAGGRGMQACEKLSKAGYSNVVNVEGGTRAWVQAGLPVVRGPKSMSLERQVRIAAGSLVLVGALLGYFAHPYWIALSGFVGAGLMICRNLRTHAGWDAVGQDAMESSRKLHRFCHDLCERVSHEDRNCRGYRGWKEPRSSACLA